MTGENSCDLCKKEECPDCTFARWSDDYCKQFECFLDMEGSCLVGAGKYCGAWERMKIHEEET